MNRAPMPGRREPLARRTPLSSAVPLRRTVPVPRSRGQLERAAALKRTVQRSKARARSRPDAVPDPIRALIWARAGGCCELCRTPLGPGANIHHRLARGAGGSSRPGRHCPSNLLLLCGHGNTGPGCHPWVETHRAAAYEGGFLVRRGNDPAQLPVLLPDLGWRYLDPAGFYAEGSP